LGNLIAACMPCNMRKRCDRLPPEQERQAFAKAEAMRPRILALEQAAKPARAPTSRRTVKINVMLTAEDVKQLEDAMIAERCRSMSAFARKLIVGQMRKIRA